MKSQLVSNVKDIVAKLRDVKAKAALGGGEEKTAKVHGKGKLTARGKIELLLDSGSFNEFNLFIRHRLGAAGDGIIIGHGTIDGRVVCVFAHDTTVFGGSMGWY